MRRIGGVALLAVLACVATGRAAEAQRGWLRRDSRLDLSFSAGGSYSTRWFTLRAPSGADLAYSPGYGPAFGAAATWWAAPAWGLRVSGTYIPTDLPDGDAHAVRNSSFGANNWFYDAAVAVRPFISRAGASDWLASTYLFAGGGGLTTGVAGSGGCAPEYPAGSGVCLPLDSRSASAGQAVVGAGVEMYPLYRGVTLFGEAALHGYRSPAHVSRAAGAREGIAFTPRASGGVRFSLGGTQHAQGVWLPLPPVRPPHPVPLDTARGPELPQPQAATTVQVCVVRGGDLAELAGRVDAASGDTLLEGGGRFTAAGTGDAGYAAGQRWFVEGAPLVHGGRGYERVGLPRIIPRAELRRVGEHQGVPLFAPAGEGQDGTLYVPVRPGCEFQPYQQQEVVRRVRG